MKTLLTFVPPRSGRRLSLLTDAAWCTPRPIRQGDNPQLGTDERVLDVPILAHVAISATDGLSLAWPLVGRSAIATSRQIALTEGGMPPKGQATDMGSPFRRFDLSGRLRRPIVDVADVAFRPNSVLVSAGRRNVRAELGLPDSLSTSGGFDTPVHLRHISPAQSGCEVISLAPHGSPQLNNPW